MNKNLQNIYDPIPSNIKGGGNYTLLLSNFVLDITFKQIH